jgi:hypothetical protein
MWFVVPSLHLAQHCRRLLSRTIRVLRQPIDYYLFGLLLQAWCSSLLPCSLFLPLKMADILQPLPRGIGHWTLVNGDALMRVETAEYTRLQEK